MTTTKERLLTLLRDTFRFGFHACPCGDHPWNPDAPLASEEPNLQRSAHEFLASVGLAPEPESPQQSSSSTTDSSFVRPLPTIDTALDQLPPAEREVIERRYPGLDQERTDAVTYTDSSGTTLLVTRPTPPPPPPPPLASEDATPFDDDEAAAPATPRKKRTATKRKAK